MVIGQFGTAKRPVETKQKDLCDKGRQQIRIIQLSSIVYRFWAVLRPACHTTPPIVHYEFIVKLR